MGSFLPLRYVKVALSSLRRFLAAESPLKMIKNAFYFISKALFVLKIFKFLFWLFGHVAKLLDKKDKVNFKFYDITICLSNSCNTHIVQYLEKYQKMKCSQLIECNMGNIFFEKSYTKCGGQTSPTPFSDKLKWSISLKQ